MYQAINMECSASLSLCRLSSSSSGGGGGTDWKTILKSLPCYIPPVVLILEINQRQLYVLLLPKLTKSEYNCSNLNNQAIFVSLIAVGIYAYIAYMCY